MSEAPGEILHPRPHLSLIQKLAALTAWGLAAAVFLTIGWLAMEPDDPWSAVSLLNRGNAMVMLIQALALGAVTSALATAIAGRILTDVGTFATALGLAAVSVQGGTASYLLWTGAAGSTANTGNLAARLACESLGWFLVILVSLGISTTVFRWIYGGRSAAHETEENDAWELLPPMAGSDFPGLGSLLSGEPGTRTAFLHGVKHTGVCGATALLAVWVLSAGLNMRSIQHGQCCFVVAAAMWIATTIACRMVPVRSVLWAVLSLVLLTSGGFAWAALRAGNSGLPPNIPASPFMRILPIQYVSVGAASAIATFWYTHSTTKAGKPRPNH